MQIQFENNVSIGIELNDNPLTMVVSNIYKHLQHVKLPYRSWDNPYYLNNLEYGQLVEIFLEYGRRVGISIQADKCLQNDQQYLNELHCIYEKNYDGNPAWLDYHDHIHLCEQFSTQTLRLKKLAIDYRDKAGLLEKPMNKNWYSTDTEVIAGDVFLSWAELGKSPYEYWKSNEPDQIDRLCELAKPWLILRPKLNVALESKNLLLQKQTSDFESWWKNFENRWCQHWNLSAWNIQHMHSVIKIGTVTDLKLLDRQLQDQIPMIAIRLN